MPCVTEHMSHRVYLKTVLDEVNMSCRVYLKTVLDEVDMSCQVYLEIVLDEVKVHALDAAALIVSLNCQMTLGIVQEVLALAVQLCHEGRHMVGVDLCGDPKVCAFVPTTSRGSFFFAC